MEAGRTAGPAAAGEPERNTPDADGDRERERKGENRTRETPLAAPGVPAASGVPGAPAAGVPGVPSVPEASGVTAAGVPGAPSVPAAASGVPGAPSVPKASGVPGAPAAGVPGVPAASGVPGAPAASGVPAASVVSAADATEWIADSHRASAMERAQQRIDALIGQVQFGQVFEYNSERGFGLICNANGVFYVHCSSVVGPLQLQVGMYVRFTVAGPNPGPHCVAKYVFITGHTNTWRNGDEKPMVWRSNSIPRATLAPTWDRQTPSTDVAGRQTFLPQGRHNGTVVEYIPSRNYGFIIPDRSAERIYVHARWLQGTGIVKGARVSFLYGTDPHGVRVRAYSIGTPIADTTPAHNAPIRAPCGPLGPFEVAAFQPAKAPTQPVQSDQPSQATQPTQAAKPAQTPHPNTPLETVRIDGRPVTERCSTELCLTDHYPRDHQTNEKVQHREDQKHAGNSGGAMVWSNARTEPSARTHGTVSNACGAASQVAVPAKSLPGFSAESHLHKNSNTANNAASSMTNAAGGMTNATTAAGIVTTAAGLSAALREISAAIATMRRDHEQYVPLRPTQPCAHMSQAASLPYTAHAYQPQQQQPPPQQAVYVVPTCATPHATPYATSYATLASAGQAQAAWTCAMQPTLTPTETGANACVGYAGFAGYPPVQYAAMANAVQYHGQHQPQQPPQPQAWWAAQMTPTTGQSPQPQAWWAAPMTPTGANYVPYVFVQQQSQPQPQPQQPQEQTD